MEEQVVIVHVRLQGGPFGSRDERKAIQALEDQIMLAVKELSAGKVDGHELGFGEYVLFMHGADADRLYEVIKPFLKATPAAAGGYAVKRYGKTDDLSSSEARVIW